MKPILSFLTIGGALAGWLCTSSAHAAIDAAISGSPPADVAELIQKWAVTITIFLSVVGTLAATAIAGFWKLRKLWSDQQTQFDAETKKTAQIESVQQIHHEQIAQINAVASAPIATIQQPGETLPKTP